MSEEKVNIKVYSDSPDLVPVTSALKQLELKGFPINVIYLNEIEISENDIIILNIESLDSAHLKNFILKKQRVIYKQREHV